MPNNIFFNFLSINITSKATRFLLAPILEMNCYGKRLAKKSYQKVYVQVPQLENKFRGAFCLVQGRIYVTCGSCVMETKLNCVYKYIQTMYGVTNVERIVQVCNSGLRLRLSSLSISLIISFYISIQKFHTAPTHKCSILR